MPNTGITRVRFLLFFKTRSDANVGRHNGSWRARVKYLSALKAFTDTCAASDV